MIVLRDRGQSTELGGPLPPLPSICEAALLHNFFARRFNVLQFFVRAKNLAEPIRQVTKDPLKLRTDLQIETSRPLELLVTSAGRTRQLRFVLPNCVQPMMTAI